MANNGRMTTGSLPRLLQVGLDKIIDHYNKSYKIMGSEIFKTQKVEKGFFEATQVAGMGMATVKGEGEPVSLDSRDQNWVYQWPIITYSKSGRITMEAIEDNQYEDQIAIIGREISKGLNHCKDFQMATVFNNGFSSTSNPDGKALFATDHGIQAGGTSSNLLSPALDMSEDGIEQLVLLIDAFVNPDGLQSDYSSKDLIIPIQLRFEADRIVKSKYRPGTPDNDISAIYEQSVIRRVLPWKRLTDTDAYFITSTADDGFTLAVKRGIKSESFKEPTTLDMLVAATERYVAFCQDWRAAVASAGA